MSSVQNEQIDELRKRKAGLEHAAFMMASESVVVPRELSEELNSLVKTLAELSETRIAQRTWTSFLGQEIEGYILRERLSAGTYSHLFRAVNEQTGESCAIKIARTDQPIIADPDDFFSKQAIRFQLELCQYVDISPNDVLRYECARLQKDTSGYFVKVLSAGMYNELYYYRMPLLEGVSLQQFSTELSNFSHSKNMQLGFFSKVCSILDEFSLSEARQYHGNLRPDSIIITKTDVILLSPGVFDIPDPNSEQASFMITTPAYYPFFEANDLFALGCTLWETACKRHPLGTQNDEARPDLFAADLREMLDYRQALGHKPLCEFFKLRLPCDANTELSEQTELTLLKAIKLAFTEDGQLTGSPGFAGAAEFKQALEELDEVGILRRRNS